MIYLDSAATTLQKPPAVARAASYAIGHLASPGRGGHRPAMLAAETAFACRQAAAQLFHVPDPEQVVFTSNATHGLNVAIKSLVQSGDTVLISGFEHNAVTRPLHALGAAVKVAGGPLFQPEALLARFEALLTDEVSCVICNHVSNVFGCIQPLDGIARLCRERAIPLIVDASQSAGCLEVSMERWGAAFIAMPGHKGLFGPQGTGLLLCAAPARPLLEGGTGSASLHQEMPDFLPDRLEAGTHNLPGIAGLLAGIRYVQGRGLRRILAHESRLVQLAAERLERLPGVRVFSGRPGVDQAGVLSFLAEGMDCETVGQDLAQRGIALRAGLHCAPLAHTTAGTLETGTVRLSVSPFNTQGEIARFADQLAWLIRRKGGR